MGVVYAVLGGPDGTGKSTVVAELARRRPTLVHRHWRPGLLPALRRLRGAPDEGVNTDPHGRQPDGALKGTLRTIYYWLDFVLGYWLRVRPVVAGGGVFVLERGWDDVCVDPLRYGLRSNRLPRLLSRVTPRPDQVLVLAAGAATIRARKPELEEAEIERQLKAWPLLSSARATRVVAADAPPSEVVDNVESLLFGRRRCAS